jgi:hypothetical protein
MSEQPVDEVVMVPNPYLAALRDKRTESLPPLYELRTALDDAVSAMDQGAWHSTTADGFYAELTGQLTTLTGVRDNVVAPSMTPWRGCRRWSRRARGTPGGTAW